MATVKVNPQFLPEMEKLGRLWLAEVGADMLQEIKASISTPGPPASLPGRPPHREHGDLLAGMHASVSKTTLAIISEEPHGEFLEKGTRHMAPRPFMTPVLVRRWQHYVQMLGKRR